MNNFAESGYSEAYLDSICEEIARLENPSTRAGKIKKCLNKDKLIEALQYGLKIHREQKNLYRVENYSLKEEIVNTKAKHEIQLKNMEAKCRQYDKDIKKMKREIDSLGEDKQHLENTIEENLKKVEEICKLCHDLEVKNDDLQSKNDHVVRQLHAVKSKNEELLDKIFSGRRKLSATQYQLQALQDEVSASKSIPCAVSKSKKMSVASAATQTIHSTHNEKNSWNDVEEMHIIIRDLLTEQCILQDKVRKLESQRVHNATPLEMGDVCQATGDV